MMIAIIKSKMFKGYHAILSVEADNKIYILDNMSSFVVEDVKFKFNKPVYALNETGWWNYKSLGNL